MTFLFYIGFKYYRMSFFSFFFVRVHENVPSDCHVQSYITHFSRFSCFTFSSFTPLPWFIHFTLLGGRQAIMHGRNTTNTRTWLVWRTGLDLRHWKTNRRELWFRPISRSLGHPEHGTDRAYIYSLQFDMIHFCISFFVDCTTLDCGSEVRQWKVVNGEGCQLTYWCISPRVRLSLRSVLLPTSTRCRT